MQEIRLGNLNGCSGGNFAGQVFSTDGVAPTLTDMQGGGRQPHIVEVEKMSDIAIPINTGTDGTCRTIKSQYHKNSEQNLEIVGSYGCTGVAEKKCVLKIRQATKQGYIELPISKFEGGVADLNYTSSTKRRGRVQGEGKICPTLTAENIPSVIELGDPDFYNFLYEYDGYIWLIRIRKLTEYECLLLMDVDSVTAIRMCKAESTTQVYKAAGNSICVGCLTAIFGMMFDGKEKIYKQDRWVDSAMNPPVEG